MRPPGGCLRNVPAPRQVFSPAGGGCIGWFWWADGVKPVRPVTPARPLGVDKPPRRRQSARPKMSHGRKVDLRAVTPSRSLARGRGLFSGWAVNRGSLGGRVHLLPEFVVTKTTTRGQALVSCRENLVEFPGVGEQQLIHLIVVGDAHKDSNRPAIFCDHHRPGLGCLQICTQMRFDVGHGCNLQSSTSSPAMNNRLRSLAPIASVTAWPAKNLVIMTGRNKIITNDCSQFHRESSELDIAGGPTVLSDSGSKRRNAREWFLLARSVSTMANCVFGGDPIQAGFTECECGTIIPKCAGRRNM